MTLGPVTTEGPWAGLRPVRLGTDAYRYPAGTVWRCDDCTREWRSTKAGVPINSPGLIRWVRHQPIRWWWTRLRAGGASSRSQPAPEPADDHDPVPAADIVTLLLDSEEPQP